MGLYIHHHLGLGDHFACNGLVHHLLQTVPGEKRLAVLKSNFSTVSSLYRGFDLKLHEVNNDGEIESLVESGARHFETPTLEGLRYLRIGFEHMRMPQWEESFYEYVNLPYSYRFSKFTLNRSSDAENSLFDLINPPAKYALCALSFSGGNCNLHLQTDLPTVFLEKRTENLLDWLKVIENATEIHVIDSSTYQLIKNLQVDCRKVFYDIRSLGFARTAYTIPPNQEWEVVIP